MDINTYNPANANITADELNSMKDLTDEQIAQLAAAYPNTPNGNAYLVYYDKKHEEKSQLYPLGTWTNLHALRKLGYKDILPYSFKDKFYQKKAVANAHKPAPTRTVDLGKNENIEGLKKEPVIIYSEGNRASHEAGSGLDPTVTDTSLASDDPKLADLQKQLQQAKDDKAHHMTIKKIESDIEAHKATIKTP